MDRDESVHDILNLSKYNIFYFPTRCVNELDRFVFLDTFHPV